MKVISKVVGAAVLMVLGTVFQAQALPITPDLAVATGLQNNTNDLEDFLFLNGLDITDLYKAEVPSGEDGAFAGAYETTFTGAPGDISGANIVYTGPGAAITIQPSFQYPSSRWRCDYQSSGLCPAWAWTSAPKVQRLTSLSPLELS